MYRSVPNNRFASHAPAGVPRSVVERLVAERDQLVNDQRRLVREVEHLRSQRGPSLDEYRALLQELDDRTAEVQALEQRALEQSALEQRAPLAPADDSERVQRLLADLENVRRHVGTEVERGVRAERERLVGTLADVRDDLTRATLDADDATRRGLEGSLARIDQRLASIGVRAFGSVGEAFDPDRHEAVARSDSSDASTVTAVVSCGIVGEDGALVRPARVVV